MVNKISIDFVKGILFVILLCFTCCIFSSLIGSINTDKQSKEHYDVVDNYNPFVYNSNNTKYERIDLNSPNNVETDSQISLLFGNAIKQTNVDITTLDIRAYLYELNGDIYNPGVIYKNNDKTSYDSKQSYSVMISDKENGDDIYLGDLTRSSDGVYRLKQNLTVENNKKIIKVYFIDKESNVKVLLLVGIFR